MKVSISLLACLLAALPAAALADSHGGDHAYARSAPSRAYQSAPHTQPASRYQAPERMQTSRYQQQQAPRYQQQSRYQAPAQRYQQRNAQPMPRYQARYESRGNYGNTIAYGQRYSGSAWQWNGGRAWVASPAYWGGGFWGGLAIGLSVNDYAVQPDSPGADLLSQYGLQQTDCNQPNLVDIFGPDGGEICAYPNDQVGPGQYQVDPSTLTLVSQ